MEPRELVAGYAAYTDAAELGVAQAEAPAVTPTASPTTSTTPVQLTVDWNC